MGLNDVTANGVVTLHYRIFVLHRRQNKDIPHQSCITPGASKGTPGTQNASRKPSEDINKEIKGGGQNLPFFVSRENKRIKPTKQSNKCVDVYV